MILSHVTFSHYSVGTIKSSSAGFDGVFVESHFDFVGTFIISPIISIVELIQHICLQIGICLEPDQVKYPVIELVSNRDKRFSSCTCNIDVISPL